ncbi:hypothetical protein [Jannaschia formosa]|uniref:hypothetical protein n=1 Tax=Jannaschia formosa TaxID=2259592 RepID=UPI000E1BC71B|nr:hypothetical protein [Jannaschia formosa]TFL18561.1 hypothetical protein DR046_08775 [Jannaschia formosa]
MRRTLPLLLLLAACGVSPEEARQEARRINALPTAELWRIQATTRSEVELHQVEAELGSRDQFRAGSAYLGKRTLPRAQPGRFRRPRQDDPDLDAIDCTDFVLEAAAQAELMGSGGPRNDRHRLDDDGDGLACNWRAELERSVAAARGR